MNMPCEKPVNPYQVLYFNPSLPSITFAEMSAKYHHFRERKMLEKVAEITGYMLVESSKLNWRQRDKWRENKFKIGYYVYYLIPPGGIERGMRI